MPAFLVPAVLGIAFAVVQHPDRDAEDHNQGQRFVVLDRIRVRLVDLGGRGG
jgi:hypothetical protein